MVHKACQSETLNSTECPSKYCFHRSLTTVLYIYLTQNTQDTVAVSALGRFLQMWYLHAHIALLSTVQHSESIRGKSLIYTNFKNNKKKSTSGTAFNESTIKMLTHYYNPSVCSACMHMTRKGLRISTKTQSSLFLKASHQFAFLFISVQKKVFFPPQYPQAEVEDFSTFQKILL